MPPKAETKIPEGEPAREYAAPPPPNPEEPRPSETKEDASWESIAFEGGGTCVPRGRGVREPCLAGRRVAPQPLSDARLARMHCRLPPNDPLLSPPAAMRAS